MRALILALAAQFAALEAELITRVRDQPLTKGLGGITVVTLDGEVCDWGRLTNRKQIGSCTGCCPCDEAWP